MTGTVRGVLLDLHRTLVTTGSYERWVDDTTARAAAAPPDRARLLTVLASVWHRAGERHPGAEWDLDAEAHRAAFVEVVLEDAGCPERFAHALYATMPDQWVPAPGAVELVRDLRAAGVRTALLSNTALEVRPRLRALGLLDHLDEVVVSAEVGLVKPDPRIFVLAAERLGLDPVECLMVGDSPAHDGGAVVTGMPCLLVPVVDGRPRLQVVRELLLP